MNVGLAGSGDRDFKGLMDALSSAEMIFGTEIPPELEFESVRAIVDWLEMDMLAWGFNPHAADFMTELAKTQGHPGLAEGLNGSWRREQIAAVVRELLGPYLRES